MSDERSYRRLDAYRAQKRYGTSKGYSDYETYHKETYFLFSDQRREIIPEATLLLPFITLFSVLLLSFML